MEKAMKIEHVFQDPKDSVEEKKAQNVTPKMATVCVGSTGTGKSSLINLFCKNQVKVGHSTTSSTQNSSLVTSETGHWLDSQGANDSSGVSDEKVLTDILKQLYDKNVTQIKVVWCVSGDMCREKDEFKTQAKFIKSLGSGVWDCCLIIKKRGDPQPDEMDGVLAAACRYGANVSECDYGHLYGYTGLEFGDLSKDRLLKKINKTKDDTARKRELLECGYLTNAEVVTEISGKLSKLSSLGISFENKECSKCGQKGDPRFIYAPCHTESEKYHPKETVSYHPKEKIKYHPADTPQDFHPKTPVHFHPGYVENRRYHPGYKKSIYYHPEGSYWNILNGDTDWRWRCCEKYKYSGDGNLKDNGCTFAHEKWTCCGYSASSGPCSSYSVYSCCSSSESSQGCKFGFECCRRETTDRGCRQEYGCCNKSVSDGGCMEKYQCCGAPSENKGCKMKYDCCDKDMGEEGCEERCKACQNEWGKGPGCVRTSKKGDC